MKTILIGLLWLWAQGAPPAQAPGPAAVNTGDEYLIGPKDVIAITIFNDEALSRPALTVDAQGTVDCPYIGRVKVAGLTARQVEDVLLKRYVPDYLVNPSISVLVKEFRNMIVWVQGSVRSPGQVELKGDANLLTALGIAGPLNTDAGSPIVITRNPAGQNAAGPMLPGEQQPGEQILVKREEIDNGRASRYRLRAGDTVYVPKAAVFFITGQIKSANSYPLTEGMTVLQALAVAGGVTDRAAKNRIYVQRVVDGRKQDVKVKETDLVQPNDTIVVPARRI